MQLPFAAPAALSAGAWVAGALEDSHLLPAAREAGTASGGALTRGLAVRFTGKAGPAMEVPGREGDPVFILGR